MRIETGNVIRYSSAAGILMAIVSDIVLDLNAAKKTIPWLKLQIIDPETKLATSSNLVRLCATDGYLKQMKVELI